MLAWSEAGAGPTVLLIHGFPLNRWMWQPQLEALAADGFRVVAPDLPGFGDSPPLEGGASMQRYAEALVELLDTLGVEKVTACGMSMGGYVLFSLLEHFPQRIAAAGFIVTRAAADDNAGKAKRSELAATARREGAAPIADIFCGLVFAEATRTQRPELVEEVRGWMLGASAEGVAAALEAMRERSDVSARLSGLSLPALVIGAEEDSAIPIEYSQTIATALPDGEFVAIPAAGHMVNLEQPELFNRALLDFLKRRVA